MTSGTISETKETYQKVANLYDSRWVFGVLLSLGLFNLVCCTPIYLGVIGWLAGKVRGDG